MSDPTPGSVRLAQMVLAPAYPWERSEDFTVRVSATARRIDEIAVDPAVADAEARIAALVARMTEFVGSLPQRTSSDASLRATGFSILAEYRP